MSRLASVVLWSVLAAAFIGPGTVTTCAAAGAAYGPALLWALSFSVLACLVLQEAVARLTTLSGSTLGEALRRQYPGDLAGWIVLVLVLGAIVVGCAAYEAGNVLGTLAGLDLLAPVPRWLSVPLLGSVAAGLLWFRSPAGVARALSLLVAIMGLAFVGTAIRLGPDLGEVVRGALVPRLPAGSGLLALGLVGTTVVPYNLFLGSGLAAGQRLRELRFGITVAIVLGGIISMGVLIVGTAVVGPFRFEALRDVLAGQLGRGTAHLLGAGLFAAGLSSAVTCALAAALAARSLFARHGRRDWGPASWRFRSVWAGVLLFGLGFGAAGASPVPVILLAQALNGVLLPLVAVFLFLAVNDRRLLPVSGLNGLAGNLLYALVLAVAVQLGTSGILRAAAAAVGRSAPSAAVQLAFGVGACALLAAVVAPALRRLRANAGAPGSGQG